MEILHELYPNYINRNKKWITIARKLYEIKKIIKQYEQEEELLSKTLKILSEEKNSKGGNFIFYKQTRKGSIDYNKIPVLKDFDLEPYRKEPVDYWKLDVILTDIINK